MQYSIFIGVTEYELTPYVIPQTVKLEESLYRELKSNANKISFQVSRDCPYIDEIILNDDETIRLEVKNDDDSWFFFGYLAGNYKGSIGGTGFAPFSLSAACPSITLLKRPWNSPSSSYTSWSGDKVCDPADTTHSFLHKVATLTGVVLSSSLPTITDTVDTSILDSDNEEYWAVLEKVLFESHYVFYFQHDGTLALYNFYISGTITPAHTFTNSNAGKIEFEAALKKYKSFSLKYKETETLLAQVISKDTTGGDAVYECNIALPAGTYYPSMGTEDKDEFADYALESGKEIVNVSAAHVDLNLETGLTYEFQNIGTRAQFRIYNPTGGTLNIRRCRIVADTLTAIKSENEARINGDDSAVYEYEAEHIHAVARAEIFIKILADYFTYSRKGFDFFSPDDVPLGTIARLYESVEGLDIFAVVSEKTTTFTKDNSKKVKYGITAITSMALAGSVVPSSVSSNPPIPEGPEGPPAIAVALSNGTHVFPASALGAVSSYANSGTLIRVYAGAAELLYDAVGTSPGTWKVTPAALRITCGAITDSGAYATVANHSAFADGDDTAQITYTIEGVTPAGEAFSLTIAQVFTKAKTGQTGMPGTPGTPGVGVVTWNLPGALISMADAHTMEKTAGTDGAYDASAYSTEKYGAAGISFRPHQVNRRLMVGLNVDPDTGGSEADIDHALCLMEDGTLEIWQSGVKVYEPETAYLVGDVFSIIADGQHVFFLQNGTIFFIAYDPGKAFAFDSSFYHLGARINYVGFSSGAAAPRVGGYLGTVSGVPDATTFAPVKMAGDWCLCTADGVYYLWTGAAWSTAGITMAMKMAGLQDLLELSESPLTVAFLEILTDRIAANEAVIQRLLANRVEVPAGGSQRWFDGQGVNRTVIEITEGRVRFLDAPDTSPASDEVLKGILGRLGVGDPILIDGDFHAKMNKYSDLGSITVSSGVASMPSAAIERANGDKLVVYRRASDGYVCCRSRIRNGTTYGAETVLYNAAAQIGDMVQEIDGRVRLCFRADASPYHEYEMIMTSGSWGSPVSVGSGAISYYLRYCLLEDNTLWMVSMVPASSAVMRRILNRDTGAWGTYSSFYSSFPAAYSLAIIEHGGLIRLAWDTSTLTQESTYDGSSWTTPINPAGMNAERMRYFRTVDGILHLSGTTTAVLITDLIGGVWGSLVSTGSVLGEGSITANVDGGFSVIGDSSGTLTERRYGRYIRLSWLAQSRSPAYQHTGLVALRVLYGGIAAVKDPGEYAISGCMNISGVGTFIVSRIVITSSSMTVYGLSASGGTPISSTFNSSTSTVSYSSICLF